MRLYLSGPITGVENYRENFRKAEEKLRDEDLIDIFNPTKISEVLPTDLTYEECMKIDFALIDMSDILVQLPGWENSRGANREYGYALGKDITIITLEELIGGEADE